MSDTAVEAARAALAATIRDVADFPEPGIVFKDITPMLADANAFRAVVAGLSSAGRDAAGHTTVDYVLGMEARGFLLGAPVALELGVGFIPVRKPDKLPGETHAVSFALEYGEATLEIHQDALQPGDRVLIIDDVLATGGTARATLDLAEACGADVVGVAMVLELTFLPGREAVGDTPLLALHSV